MLNNKLLFVLMCILALCSCTNRTSNNKISDYADSHLICFDQGQKLSFEIKTGNLNTIEYPGLTECQGFIMPSPADIAVVSLPMPGTIKKLLITPGQFIAKGSIIAIIENVEFISLQEEYLIAKSSYHYSKENFKRQGELNLENATSMKVMQQAEYEYRMAEASLSSLKKKLEIAGISSDSIDTDRIQSVIKVYAPISGIISDIQVNTGMFCNREIALCKISGLQNPVLQILAKSEYYTSIESGNEISFYFYNKPDKKYKALVQSKEPISSDFVSFLIYAQISSPDEQIKIGSKVLATIDAGKQILTTIPLISVISENNKSYFLIKTSDNCYRMTEFKPGRLIENEIEITDNSLISKEFEIVTAGAGNIYQKYLELDKSGK